MAGFEVITEVSQTHRSRFRPDRFFHSIDYSAIRAGVSILIVAWVAAHVWGDLQTLVFPSFFVGEQKANAATIPLVPARCCKVTITDMDGIEHTAQVNANSLYEAVALGLRAIKKSSWAGEIPEGLTTVTVHVIDDPIEHTVQMKVFRKWITRQGGSPSDRSARAKVREILR
jgi:hypothetical protein